MIKKLRECQRCLYYLKDSTCLKFSKLKTDLNGPKFEIAKECRADPHKCGELGMYYISNLLK